MLLGDRRARGYALAAVVAAFGTACAVAALLTVPPGTDPTILTTGLLALAVIGVAGAYRLHQQIQLVLHREGAHRRGYRTLSDQMAMAAAANRRLAVGVSQHGVSYVPPRERGGFHVKAHVRHEGAFEVRLRETAARAFDEWTTQRQRARIRRQARAAARPVCARINQAFEEVLGDGR